MSNKLKVGVDFDNILSTSTETYLKIYNGMFKENVKIEDVDDFDFRKVFDRKNEETLEAIWKTNTLWNNIKMIKDSYESLKFLNENCELYIVTATYIESVEIKMKWLKNNFPFIKDEQVIIIRNKQLIDLDYLIDDYQNNLINGKYKGILFKYPWNKNFDESQYKNIVKVDGWKDTIKIIKEEI